MYSIAALLHPKLAGEFEALQDRLRERILLTWQTELNARRGHGGLVREEVMRIEVVELQHRRCRSRGQGGDAVRATDAGGGDVDEAGCSGTKCTTQDGDVAASDSWAPGAPRFRAGYSGKAPMLCRALRNIFARFTTRHSSTVPIARNHLYQVPPVH